MKHVTMTGSVLILLAATPSWADVTVMSTVTAKGMGAGGAMQSVTYVKGTKMRTETGDTVVIHDASSRQMIVLNAKKKEAEVYDVAKLGAEMQKGGLRPGEPKVELTPTGQKKEILGRSCDEYALTISVPMGEGSQGLTMTMTGPIWVAKGAPGSRDYAAFYKAAAENGMFFGNPQQAKNQGGQMKSQTEMYRAIAELNGIPYQMDTQIKFEGSGMLAGMMNKVGGVSSTMTVSAVSTDPVPDDKFAVPAGYKTTNR